MYFATGKILQTLEGHPRTPWTVKYNPRDSNMVVSSIEHSFAWAVLEPVARLTVFASDIWLLPARAQASGCLGFQVRIWDCKTGACMHLTQLNHAIISLAFHPYADILAGM